MSQNLDGEMETARSFGTADANGIFAIPMHLHRQGDVHLQIVATDPDTRVSRHAEYEIQIATGGDN